VEITPHQKKNPISLGIRPLLMGLAAIVGAAVVILFVIRYFFL